MKQNILTAALALAMVLSWSLLAQAEAPKRPAGKAGEAGKAGQRPQGRPSPEMMAKILERFDANKNGRLDPDEMQTARAEFQKMQANGGKGAPGANGGKGAPAGKAAPGGDKRQEIIKKFDKDGDGQLNEAERAAAKAAFANKAGNK